MINSNELASFFQSVRIVTHSKIMVCIAVPPIIPDHMPCSNKLISGSELKKRIGFEGKITNGRALK